MFPGNVTVRLSWALQLKPWGVTGNSFTRATVGETSESLPCPAVAALVLRCLATQSLLTQKVISKKSLLRLRKVETAISPPEKMCCFYLGELGRVSYCFMRLANYISRKDTVNFTGFGCQSLFSQTHLLVSILCPDSSRWTFKLLWGT